MALLFSDDPDNSCVQFGVDQLDQLCNLVFIRRSIEKVTQSIGRSVLLDQRRVHVLEESSHVIGGGVFKSFPTVDSTFTKEEAVSTAKVFDTFDTFTMNISAKL